MTVPVLTALGDETWEADLVARLDAADGLRVARRCVDVVELLAVAATGQGRAALVSAAVRRFDAATVDRLRAGQVAVVGVHARDDEAAQVRLTTVGVRHTVPADADAAVLAAVVADAVDELTHGPSAEAGQRTYSDPTSATHAIRPPGDGSPVAPSAQRGSVLAVWGPTGAPGRTTVAVGLADELARLARPSLLIDADVYGGVVAPMLGLLDESPGLAAACRQAGSSRLDATALAALAWQLGPHLRVLTGIPRADRWPELRPGGVGAVLEAARTLAEFTVCDCGFAVESDEEISFDTLAPRRNGATLAALDAADLIVAVGAADPVGVQRLVRGLAELSEAEIDTPVWVVLNKVRAGPVPGRPESELAAALSRFTGRSPAALLPWDLEATDQALRSGKTLAEVRSGSPLRRALAELAGALAGTGVSGARTDRTRRRRGRRHGT